MTKVDGSEWGTWVDGTDVGEPCTAARWGSSLPHSPSSCSLGSAPAPMGLGSGTKAAGGRYCSC